MKRLSHYWYSLPVGWRDFMVLLLVVGAFAAVVACLTGCAIPTRAHLDVATGEITTTEVGYTVPMTGLVPSTSDVEKVDGGWLGIAAMALAAVGGLQFAGPKSWANWLAILKPGTSWGTTGHALAANLGMAHTPKEAKSNETQKPEPPT